MCLLSTEDAAATPAPLADADGVLRGLLHWPGRAQRHDAFRNGNDPIDGICDKIHLNHLQEMQGILEQIEYFLSVIFFLFSLV